MTIDQEAIDEFRKIYKQEYGIELSSKKAHEYANKLITLVKIVYGRDLPDKIDLTDKINVV